MKSRSLLGTLLCLGLISWTAVAQETRSAARTLEISHAPFNYIRKGGANHGGGCADVSVTLTDSVALVGQFCGTNQSLAGKDVDPLIGYRGGARFSRRPGNRFTTFIQALAGGESGYRHVGFANNSGFSFGAGGGADVGLKNWLGLRIVQVDYQFTRVTGRTLNSVRLGAGLVLRIGRR